MKTNKAKLTTIAASKPLIVSTLWLSALSEKEKLLYIALLTPLTVILVCFFVKVVLFLPALYIFAIGAAAVMLVTLVHTAAVFRLNRDKVQSYLANLITVMFIQSAVFAFAPLFRLTAEGIMVYYMAVSLFGINEHCRRVKLLGVKPAISIIYGGAKVIAALILLYLLNLI
jgi:hypothetical protein